MTTALALDLATTTGWALRSGLGLTSGTWDLAGKGALHKTRWLNLWDRLTALGSAHDIETVVYEEVMAHHRPARMVGGKRHAPGANIHAAHLFGSFKETVLGWAEMNGACVVGIPVATIKRVATDRGNANKAAMLAAAQSRWPDQRVETHDQADALWILEAWRGQR